ncbi:hypothetical protein [Cetobacterium sp. 2G large]|uniref:hypothetical protein n=1 Tax=Cetobacterium sp. 2G large TaxID=2759680 RepID=UPI00163C95BB|nr:hypothetical protein [Cetobacterium sp. 2G large]MBC2854131.1 hypothetical protein [Cetobacterium sp. 2G large]
MKKNFFLMMLIINMLITASEKACYTNSINNETIKTIKIKIKVVPSLNIIVTKDKNKVLKNIEIKGTAAKETLVKINKKEVKIIASCDNYKW